MIDIKSIISDAAAQGFSLAAPLDISSLRPQQSVRDFCASGKCRSYEHSWSCPPALGSIDDCLAEMQDYNCGIIVQSTAALEDEFDFETILELGEQHRNNFREFTYLLRDKYRCRILPLSSDVCSHCDKCTYPDSPCRHPDIRMRPLEGCGILVSELCRSNNIPASHGRNTFTYISCYLFA